MKHDIVVFGAGIRGEKNVDVIINMMGYKIKTIIDNHNYGHAIQGVYVNKASRFLAQEEAKNSIYILGGVFYEEMYHQLVEANIPTRHIYTIQGFMGRYYEFHLSHNRCEDKKAVKNVQVTIFDCSVGFGLGGVEQWTYTVGRELKKSKRNILLYSNTKKGEAPLEFQEDVLLLPGLGDCAWDIQAETARMYEYIKQYESITFIVAHINSFAYMAAFIKRKFSEKIKVISVIHSNLSSVMCDNMLAEYFIDKFLCVNHEMYKYLIKNQALKDRVYFKETLINAPDLKKNYVWKQEEPLRIGYACRLEKEHKRSDLICSFVSHLEENNCNYVLNIAGEGSCYELIHQYIITHNLEDKVRLLGLIDYSNMYSFWQAQDIAINLSETEGCSLSMLEAMACGCVMISTNTAGIEWFIENNKNGYLVEIGDIQEMSQKAEYLCKRRDILPEMGRKAHETVKKKCSIKAYMDFLEKHIL